jgi:hypothetical protein
VIISAHYAGDDQPSYLVVDTWEQAAAMATREPRGSRLITLHWLGDGDYLLEEPDG